MKEAQEQMKKDEIGDITYRKNKEIGELFNEKNELKMEI